jgi:hypothetical protein
MSKALYTPEQKNIISRGGLEPTPAAAISRKPRQQLADFAAAGTGYQKSLHYSGISLRGMQKPRHV